jgi:ADP-ribose pyrophosphatase YjhB (NUDIX family)
MNFKKAKHKGLTKHFAIGAIIKKGDKYLLIDRKKAPFGWAVPAGHIDQSETEKQTLKREIKEEVNLNINSSKLIFHDTLKFGCTRIGSYHELFVYSCKTSGNIKIQKSEVKKYGWFTEKQIKDMKMEPIWNHVFKKLNIL